MGRRGLCVWKLRWAVPLLLVRCVELFRPLATANLDPAWLGCLGLRQGQGEDAVAEGRVDLLDLDREVERESARELAGVELPQVPLLALGRLRAVPLGGDGEHAAINIDVDVLLADARQERLDLQFVGGAMDIDREGIARLGGSIANTGADETTLQELAHRVAQAEHLAERIPRALGGHRATSFRHQ